MLVVVLGSSRVVSGVPRLVPPAATAATVVEVGLGAFPGSPNACRASTTMIPAVATPVAAHGRRDSAATTDPVDDRTPPLPGWATLPHRGPRPGTGWVRPAPAGAGGRRVAHRVGRERRASRSPVRDRAR